MTDPVVEETVKGHKRLERNITLLAIGTFVTVAIGGLVQITPLFYLDNTIEEVEGVRPYTPLEQAGRDIYIREGCYSCHSQMIRPFTWETARYGAVSEAERSIYDALAMASQGREPEAQAALEDAIARKPDRLRPQVFAANGALALGHIDQGLSYLDRALEIEPESFEAQLLQVFALHQAGRHGEARDSARLGWDSNPLNARLGMLHAQQIAQSGAVGAQIAILETVIESCPGYFVAWCALGLASFRHQRFAVARELLGRYLTVVPQNIDARFALAASELRLGRIPQGREQLELLLEFHPDHVSALNLLERLNPGGST